MGSKTGLVKSYKCHHGNDAKLHNWYYQPNDVMIHGMSSCLDTNICKLLHFTMLLVPSINISHFSGLRLVVIENCTLRLLQYIYKKAEFFHHKQLINICRL